MPAPTIKLQDALLRMRDLTKKSIPFSFSYISYSEQQRSSDGLKVVANALLRPGYREDQSDKANILIAYTDLSNDNHRQFYLPLLMSFNGQLIEI
jgi:hypothetical protein